MQVLLDSDIISSENVKFFIHYIFPKIFERIKVNEFTCYVQQKSLYNLWNINKTRELDFPFSFSSMRNWIWLIKNSYKKFHFI